MNQTLHKLMMMSLLAASVGALAAGCVPPGDSSAGLVSCDPEESDLCVCETDEGEACDDPDDLDCSCTMPAPDQEEGDEEQEPAPAQAARFVMIEDMTPRVAGDAPGADLDAVGLLKASGGEHFATAIEDFKLGGANNEYANPSELLGAPDARCQKSGFVSLGGQQAGGYVIVSFGTDNNDLTIQNGDSIKVYELGGTLCPGSGYDDDPYSVSVSVSTDLGTFQEIGQGGEGRNILPVRGL